LVLALGVCPVVSTAAPVELPGLLAPASVTRDAQGIAHIRAANSHDLYYLQGWVHAGDRLFQMDLTRRQPSGTLAELFGSSELPGDVQSRTIGLRRAAERSAAALSGDTLTALRAYADGVNDWVAATPAMPPEYGFLGLVKANFRPWDEIDSIVIAKAIAFSLSFDLDIGLSNDFAAYLQALGPAGAVVFSQDVFRSQPFDCASTVPDATGEYPFIPVPGPANPEACPSPAITLAGKAKGKAKAAGTEGIAGTGAVVSPVLKQLGRKASENLRRSDFIRGVLDADGTIGSNEWGVTRALGANGRPIIANDPHLSLNTPSTFYPIGLESPGMNVFGSSFPGVAFVILGHNKHIHWGATTNPLDVTDTFVELLVFDATGTPVATVFQGEAEPVQLVPEQFYYNNFAGGLTLAPPGQGGIPAATVIVPRRNNGPIIAVLETPGPGSVVPALSVQYTGFSATREADTFRLWNEARNLKQFQEGLQFFDFGSQNWIYGDNAGNVAYFTSAEMPVRADLQQGIVAAGNPDLFPPGLPIPPWMIRDGTSGAHEWLPVQNLQPGQAVPFEVLRQDEMPHTVNPSGGWFVNANNDPAGTTLDNDPLNQLRIGGQGIYYLNPGYADGLRAGSITRRVRHYAASQGELSPADLQSIQADVSLLDARFFVPYIQAALDNAGQDGKPAALASLAADPRIVEAVGRLAEWDFTTPTGIQAGYDAGDPVVPHWSMLPEPSQQEIRHSVAATIYSVWRGQAIRMIVDAPLGSLPKPGSSQAITALQHLLRTDGGSGIVDFFEVPGLTDFADRRDAKLLAALREALELLAADRFAAAFGNSSNQDDYRWGKLHRIVFDHPFVPQLSVPPAGGAQPVPGLPGFPTDGGFGAVDASNHSARADSVNGFMFGSGPVRRYVGEPQSAFGSLSESIWAGGTSGIPGSPYYANLLPYWLTNNTLPLVLRARDADGGVTSRFVPQK